MQQRDFNEVLKEADSYLIKRNDSEKIFLNYQPKKKQDIRNGGDFDINDKRAIIADPEQTVVYLDPPYFLTVQYKNSFCDMYHLDLMNWMRQTKCDWVMSCKDRLTNKTKDTMFSGRYETKENEPLINSLYDYYVGLLYGYKEDYSCGHLVIVADIKSGKKQIKNA